jgi:hypothetical protein
MVTGDETALAPASSIALAVSTCVPIATPPHTTAYGAELLVPINAPSA